MIALVPQQAQNVAPPRVLAVPFEMGRPLGVPNDAAFQHRVLDAALGLLTRNEGSVFEIYTEEAPSAGTGAASGWSCPVTFTKSQDSTTLAQRVLDEIALLQPWYDKGRSQRGFTSVGLANLSLEDCVGLLSLLLADHATSKVPEEFSLGDYSLADAIKLAAEDLKAFYNEAATSQPGAASSQQIEDWYWGESNAGELVRAVKKATADHPDQALKITGQFLLVPHSQALRDS